MALTKISEGGFKDDATSQAKIADEAVDEARLQISNAGSNGQFLSKQSGNTGGLTWAAVNQYTHPNHSGEVTSTADGAQVIADNVVDEANLKVSNAPTNGYMLTAQSGNTGGLTWAEAPAGGLSEYDQWTVGDYSTSSTWNWHVVGSGTPQAVSIARVNSTQNPAFAKIGTGMSYSSGVWTFPSTGKWEVQWQHIDYSTASGNRSIIIDYSSDGGSSWTGTAGSDLDGIARSQGAGGNGRRSLSITTLLNITNTSNQKIRFILDSGNDYQITGSSQTVTTNWIFKKVG